MDYYIDPGGSDGDAGTTPNSAWRSFRNLIQMHAGDRVRLRRGGVWNETLHLPAGTSNGWVEIGAYGDGAPPAIDGEGLDFAVAAERGQSHVTLRQLDIRGARAYGVYLTAGTHDIVVEECALHDHGRCGYNAYMPAGEARGLVVRKCDIYRNALGGIAASGRVDGMRIEFNRVRENCLSDHLDDFTAGIRIISNNETDRVVGVLTQGNVVGRNGRGLSADRGYGIWYDTPGADGVIRWNRCFENNRAGIQFESGGRDGGALIYGNVCDGNETGISVARRTWNCRVYNNTCVRNATSFWLNGEYPDDPVGISHNEFRNNIGQQASRAELRVTNGGENDGRRGTGNIFKRNSFGRERSGFIEWGLGNALNSYGEFERLYGGPTESIRSEAGLKTDFSLAADSPCIGRAEDVGLVTGFGFAPFGAPPDLGAVPRIAEREIRLGEPFCGLGFVGGFAQRFAVWDKPIALEDLKRLTREG